MSYARVRALLAERSLEVLGKLRSEPSPELVALRRELEEATRCLERCERVGIDGRAQVHVLPTSSGGGFGEYRILDDQESETREDWLELEIDGAVRRLSGGDLLVEKGPAREKRRATP